MSRLFNLLMSILGITSPSRTLYKGGKDFTELYKDDFEDMFPCGFKCRVCDEPLVLESNDVNINYRCPNSHDMVSFISMSDEVWECLHQETR